MGLILVVYVRYFIKILILVGGFGGNQGLGGNQGFGGNLGFGNFGNEGFGGFENVDPREAYKEQNIKLKEMGFVNDDANFEALKKTMGNVDAAVERLLNMLG